MSLSPVYWGSLRPLVFLSFLLDSSLLLLLLLLQFLDRSLLHAFSATCSFLLDAFTLSLSLSFSFCYFVNLPFICPHGYAEKWKKRNRAIELTRSKLCVWENGECQLCVQPNEFDWVTSEIEGKEEDEEKMKKKKMKRRKKEKAKRPQMMRPSRPEEAMDAKETVSPSSL